MTRRPLTPEVDLRGICRGAGRLEVLVYLIDNDENRTPWLHLGSTSLEQASNRLTHRWALTARMGAESPERGVPTDCDHSSAYACKLPLVGVAIDSIRYHQPYVRAFIDPTLDVTDAHDFYVPTSSEYDPRKHPKAVECTLARCIEAPHADGGGPHVIVPEGFYVPPFNRELYETVRGNEVEIRFICLK